MKKFVLLVGVICGWSWAGLEMVPIQERAQGQSLVGAHLLNDSVFANPASSAFTQVYSMEGFYELGNTLAASILDTKTSGIGGGLAYFRKEVDASKKVMQGARLTFGGPLTSNVGIGLGGKMIWAPSLTSQENVKLTDLDIGMLVNFETIQFGAVARNIFGGDKRIGQVAEWAAGGRINWEKTMFFSVAAYGEKSTPYQYGFGAEYVSPSHYALKGGYRFQPNNHTSFWSVGASIISQKMSLHYALEVPNQAPDKLQHTFAANMLM